MKDRSRPWSPQRLLGSLLSGLTLGALVSLILVLSTNAPAFHEQRHEESSATSASSQREVSVLVSGDLLWHETVWQSGMTEDGGWDFAPVFGPMHPLIQSVDMAICHEEVPFADWEGPFTGYPQFAIPPQVVDGIVSAGWDFCTTASNHSVDAGTEGLMRTQDVFEAAGIGHAGTSRSPEEAATPRIFETDDGVKIGVVEGTYGTNGLPVEEPWMVQDLDPDSLLEQARITREAGADIVMVAMHAGDEGIHEPTEQQEELAQILTASDDVDVVYGHHVHAVQPIEKVNGKWVVYGLGNMIAQQLPENEAAYEGMSVRFTFSPVEDDVTSISNDQPRQTPQKTRWEVSELHYIPTIISPFNELPVFTIPISDAIAQGVGDPNRAETALRNIREVVLSRGAAEDPTVTEG